MTTTGRTLAERTEPELYARAATIAHDLINWEQDRATARNWDYRAVCNSEIDALLADLAAINTAIQAKRKAIGRVS